MDNTSTDGQSSGSQDSDGFAAERAALNERIRDAKYREVPMRHRRDYLYDDGFEQGYARGVDASNGNTGNEDRASYALNKNRSRRSYDRGYMSEEEGQNYKNNENNMYNSPTIVPVPVGGGFGGFGGYGGAQAVAPAYGGPALIPLEDKTCEILLAIGDTRSDVKDSESRTGNSIHHLQDTITTNQFTTLSKICDVEKEAIRNNGELSAKILQTENALSRQIETCCCDLKLQHAEDRAHQDEKFCALERRTDKDFADIKEREDARQIRTLQEDLALCKNTQNNSALAAAMIEAMKCAGVIVPAPTTSSH